MQIIPAILTNDKQQAEAWLKQIEDLGKFDRVQIDFVDDSPEILAPNFQLDAHIMTTKKLDLSSFDRIIPQIEIITNPQDYKCLAVDLDTPIEIIKPYLHNLDLVLVMAVKYGKGGQKFEEKILEKIKWLKQKGVRVCVDGGVTQELLPELEKLGVDEVAVGMPRVLEWK